ncbi:MAG TPA: HNH endonuclease signature motif containing protein, partial [Phaeodactylibacter sp.]|nr:HNH endonuclease signature motif containing protein [Phaeodactylibacter sp.]
MREIVAKRAQYRCEYCQIQENRTFYKFQVDHIISVKHGGITEIDNLALACTVCNRNKGSDLGTYIDDKLEELVRFYNPRKD